MSKQTRQTMPTSDDTWVETFWMTHNKQRCLHIELKEEMEIESTGCAGGWCWNREEIIRVGEVMSQGWGGRNESTKAQHYFDKTKKWDKRLVWKNVLNFKNVKM